MEEQLYKDGFPPKSLLTNIVGYTSLAALFASDIGKKSRVAEYKPHLFQLVWMVHVANVKRGITFGNDMLQQFFVSDATTTADLTYQVKKNKKSNDFHMFRLKKVPMVYMKLPNKIRYEKNEATNIRTIGNAISALKTVDLNDLKKKSDDTTNWIIEDLTFEKDEKLFECGVPGTDYALNTLLFHPFFNTYYDAGTINLILNTPHLDEHIKPFHSQSDGAQDTVRRQNETLKAEAEAEAAAAAKAKGTTGGGGGGIIVLPGNFDGGGAPPPGKSRDLAKEFADIYTDGTNLADGTFQYDMPTLAQAIEYFGGKPGAKGSKAYDTSQLRDSLTKIGPTDTAYEHLIGAIETLAKIKDADIGRGRNPEVLSTQLNLVHMFLARAQWPRRIAETQPSSATPEAPQDLIVAAHALEEFLKLPATLGAVDGAYQIASNAISTLKNKYPTQYQRLNQPTDGPLSVFSDVSKFKRQFDLSGSDDTEIDEKTSVFIAGVLIDWIQLIIKAFSASEKIPDDEWNKLAQKIDAYRSVMQSKKETSLSSDAEILFNRLKADNHLREKNTGFTRDRSVELLKEIFQYLRIKPTTNSYAALRDELVAASEFTMATV